MRFFFSAFRVQRQKKMNINSVITGLIEKNLTPKHPLWQVEYISNKINDDEAFGVIIKTQKVVRIYKVIQNDTPASHMAHCDITNNICTPDFITKLKKRIKDNDPVWEWNYDENWYILSVKQLA